MFVASTITYTILANDPDGYTPVTLSLPSTLPSFITNSGFTFTISPNYLTPITTYPVSFVVSDSVK